MMMGIVIMMDNYLKKSSLNHFRMYAEKKAAKMPHHIKHTELWQASGFDKQKLSGLQICNFSNK